MKGIMLEFKSGHPERPGYYMVLSEYCTLEREKYPFACYWNGEHWAFSSPEDDKRSRLDDSSYTLEDRFVALWAEAKEVLE